MKIIIKPILLLFLILVAYCSQSQVSGFMGKKNVLSAAVFLKSSFVMPNKNGKSGYFSFNDRYSIAYERVITRNKSLQFHATTFETYYNLTGYTDYETAPMYKMSSIAFGGDFIMYQPSHLAPLGAYASFGFDVIISTVDVDTAYFNQLLQYALVFPLYSKTQYTTTHIGVNMKTGVKQIFFNCLSIDFNFQLGAILSGNISGTQEFEDKVEPYLDARVSNRLWGHYLWGVNCAIGYVF
ncbi:MAG: hypothetical protein NTZ33_04990 [Bacteroidetes bacterium]|nr:hypothetical protein [Bacteroidota bacterium]